MSQSGNDPGDTQDTDALSELFKKEEGTPTPDSALEGLKGDYRAGYREGFEEGLKELNELKGGGTVPTFDP